MTRVLVAHKKSRLQIAEDTNDESVRELLERDDISVQSWRASHARHIQSLQTVLDVLDAGDLSYVALPREEVEDANGFDLVVAVGGDGTVLDLSHRIDSVPLLAINSDPVKSRGYFCAGDADDFEDFVARALDGSWKPFELNRFYVRLNGVRHGYPILNDVLVCHENPAAVSNMLLKLGESEPEGQKSSGIWISTAAGSTAAIRSAGGYVMPLASREIQYVVREPCPPNVGAYRHVKGIRNVDDGFELISRMDKGRVYLDGPHLSVPFTIGDHFSVDGGAPPLRLFGVEEKSRD